MKEIRKPRKRKGRNVTIFKSRFAEPNGKTVQIIPQLRLARIQQLQSNLTNYQQEVKTELSNLMTEISKGATIQPGPIRVFHKKDEEGNPTLEIK